MKNIGIGIAHEVGDAKGKEKESTEKGVRTGIVDYVLHTGII